MIVLFWFLLIFLILGLSLLLYFLFYILLPSIKNPDSNITENPVFSETELNFVVPKPDKVPESAKVAFVMCTPEKEFNLEFLKFNPGQSCLVADTVFHSGNRCSFACIGLGDCVKTCPQEAIFIKNHTAVVSDLCIGCGLCVNTCPKKIIKLIDRNTKTHLVCSNKDPDLAGCSRNKKEENIQTVSKKDFKLWEQCYKIFKRYRR